MSAPEPCLVLDGSARAGVRVGVLSGGRWVGQGISPDGALEGLFGCVEAALADAKLSLADIRSFALCVGPGSVLGIRIAALAVRSPKVRAVRGRGLMWGVDVTEPAKDVVGRALEKGLIVVSAGDHTLRLLPPLVMTRADLVEGVAMLEAAIG